MAKNKKAKPGEEFFFVHGPRVSTFTEMKKEIKNMSEKDFSFHVNEYKNDLYNWLKDCINPELANKIQNVRNKEEFLKRLG